MENKESVSPTENSQSSFGSSENYNLARTLAFGLTIVSIGIAIGVVGYILSAKTNQPNIKNTSSSAPVGK